MDPDQLVAMVPAAERANKYNKMLLIAVVLVVLLLIIYMVWRKMDTYVVMKEGACSRRNQDVF